MEKKATIEKGWEFVRAQIDDMEENGFDIESFVADSHYAHLYEGSTGEVFAKSLKETTVTITFRKQVR